MSAGFRLSVVLRLRELAEDAAKVELAGALGIHRSALNALERAREAALVERERAAALQCASGQGGATPAGELADATASIEMAEQAIADAETGLPRRRIAISPGRAAASPRQAAGARSWSASATGPRPPSASGCSARKTPISMRSPPLDMPGRLWRKAGHERRDGRTDEPRGKRPHGRCEGPRGRARCAPPIREPGSRGLPWQACRPRARRGRPAACRQAAPSRTCSAPRRRWPTTCRRPPPQPRPSPPRGCPRPTQRPCRLPPPRPGSSSSGRSRRPRHPGVRADVTLALSRGGRRRRPYAHFHDGLDLAAPLGTTVRAAAAGVVIAAAGRRTVRSSSGSGTTTAARRATGTSSPSSPSARVTASRRPGDRRGRAHRPDDRAAPPLRARRRRPGDRSGACHRGRAPARGSPCAERTSAASPVRGQLAAFDAVADQIPYAPQIREAAVKARSTRSSWRPSFAPSPASEPTPSRPPARSASRS